MMLPAADLLTIVAIALASALGVGALGLIVLRLTRRSSVLVHVCVVVVSAILSVAVGMSAAAQAMYVSAHDLTVTFWVMGISASVSVMVALFLGRALTRNSHLLLMMTRDLGEGRRLDATSVAEVTSELTGLADELSRTSRKLAEARDDLAAMDASRRELVAWISHDLRTPLAGLRAMAEALEDGLADDPQRFHRQMRSQVDHLTAMVDDLFELSMIHSGNLSLSMEPVSLYDLVSDAVAELHALADSRSIRLSEAGSGELTVVGDPRELARVLGNLLINAIQRSPRHSEIAITARDDGDGHVILTVTDSGGGIPEQDLSQIFQAGWRATSARTPEQFAGASTGAGLGLAIVQGIVLAHSGEITVENIPGGCRFDVRLPLHSSAAIG